MGKCTDMTGLQFRMLNTKKGPAVRAPRTQCDKKAYQFRMKWICEREPNLDVRQGQVASLVHKGGKVTGVQSTMEIQYNGSMVVITTGTFLKGLMHVGANKQTGGRAGESSVGGFSESLKSVGPPQPRSLFDEDGFPESVPKTRKSRLSKRSQAEDLMYHWFWRPTASQNKCLPHQMGN